MQLFTRPDKPPGFENAIKPHRDAAQTEILARLAKATAAADAPPKKGKAKGAKAAAKKGKAKGARAAEPELFPDKWSDFKEFLAEAQHEKCGYCEMRVGNQAGDVDHFRPKGAIWALLEDPDTWGRERRYRSNVVGRKRRVLCEFGYWWLAYDWSNYVLSCLVCNQKWKLSYFPVAGKKRTLPPHKGLTETSLLLDPFGDVNPAEHLRFSDFGQVEAYKGSRRGFETIRTCGLDRRPSLMRARARKAVRAYYLVDRILDSHGDERDESLCDIHALGDNEEDHSGMVRAIFEQEVGVGWDVLSTKVAGIRKRRAALPTAARPSSLPRDDPRRKKALAELRAAIEAASPAPPTKPKHQAGARRKMLAGS
jgi:hypothetical protein